VYFAALKEPDAGADLKSVEERLRMTRSLKLSAVVSLIAYVGGAVAVLWKRA
jgi:hypothetical protein